MAYPNVKAEMARKNITAQELAKDVGVTAQTFSSWMSGKTAPSIKSAIKIAEILERDVAYLFAE